MMTFLDMILGRKRVLVKENERAVALYRGELLGIYGPGEHALPNRRNGLETFKHDIGAVTFVSPFEKALFDKLPEVAAKHLTVFRTGRTEVALIERDGQIHTVLAPDRKLVVWTDAGRCRAVRNAGRLAALERRLHIDVEPRLQRHALRWPRLVDALNAGYAAGNVGLTVGWLS